MLSLIKIGPSWKDLMREQLVRDIEQLIPVLRRYAWFLVRDVHGADDLVQDCLERAVRHLDQFREGTDLRAWSLTIMRNCFFDGKRREKRFTEVALDDLPHEAGRTPARQESSLLLQELAGAFLNLPVPQKLAMICVIFEGLPYNEAAEVLGVSVGTVKSRVSRGREALRQATAAEPRRKSA
jgi:RNA polymerase sigma-70 factor (ECF subfamily)